jgi:hypothetical protein
MQCFARRGVGVELGVHLGLNALELMRVLEPAKLHLVDPWQVIESEDHNESWYTRVSQAEMDGYREAVANAFEPEIARGTVEIHRMMSWDAMAKFSDNSLDWVYVDADHSYASVKRDLEASYAKVKPGGMIGGDDYKLKGWWGDSIVRAVHELLVTRPVKLKLVMDQQYVIEKLA